MWQRGPTGGHRRRQRRMRSWGGRSNCSEQTRRFLTRPDVRRVARVAVEERRGRCWCWCCRGRAKRCWEGWEGPKCRQRSRSSPLASYLAARHLRHDLMKLSSATLRWHRPPDSTSAVGDTSCLTPYHGPRNIHAGHTRQGNYGFLSTLTFTFTCPLPFTYLIDWLTHHDAPPFPSWPLGRQSPRSSSAST